MERIVFVYRGEKGPEEIVVERRGSFCSLARGGGIERADLAALPDGRLSLLFEDGRQVSGRVAGADPGAVTVVSRGISRRLELAEPLRTASLTLFPEIPGAAAKRRFVPRCRAGSSPCRSPWGRRSHRGTFCWFSRP